MTNDNDNDGYFGHIEQKQHRMLRVGMSSLQCFPVAKVLAD